MTFLTANILIVEDDELNRELLKRRLEADNHKVCSVSTGTKALEQLEKEKFDFILLDIMLPDIDGVTLLEKIKSDLKLESTHVIMVTANSEREMVLKCIDSGAIDYFIKPYSISLVKLRIWRYLKNSTKQLSDEEFSHSKILLVDDQELNRDVLAHRLIKSGYEITSVTNGYEAITVLQKENFDLILLDIMMPDISGIDVLKNIRSGTKHSNTPVIMITALEDVQTVDECIEAGADDYIMKPLNTTLLKLRIASCLQLRKCVNV